LNYQWLSLGKIEEHTQMINRVISGSVLTLALITAGFGTTFAGDDVEKLIAHSRAAAPAKIGANATVVVNGEVVAKGNNGWTCLPEVFPGDGAAVCIDAVWGEMMGALGAKAPYTATGVGLSYMLLGEPPGSGVSNSNPHHADHANSDDYTETGPHLMLIVPKELMEGMTDDPSSGGPYVMWKDTDYAHIMIPVDTE
jgi:hypothetical protein